MKLTADVLVAAACWTAGLASASSAHVYTYDRSEPRHEPQRTLLDPTSARLVLAQRAGVEDYHNADWASDGVLDAINEFGVRKHLFGNEEVTKRAMIFLDAQGESAEIPALRTYSSFEIDTTPVAHSKALFGDLARQSDPHAFPDSSGEEAFERLDARLTNTKDGSFFMAAKSKADAEAVFKQLVLDKAWSITVMSASSTDGDVKNTKAWAWGSYGMPGTQSPLKKRQQKEELLADTHSFKSVQSPSEQLSSFAANTSKPLRGILPACFHTQAACESATRNCTGHGSCSRKYHDKDAAGSGGDCYSCKCGVAKSADGKSTTRWGGPACQKKDISFEFWLITLFTVGLIFLIGFAIGTVYEMGELELPSVIGAGVSGPTARK